MSLKLATVVIYMELHSSEGKGDRGKTATVVIRAVLVWTMGKDMVENRNHGGLILMLIILLL